MPEPTHRPEVLEELVGLAVRANADRSHADLCGCATWPERCASGYIPGEWEHGDEAHTIAAVLPAHERQVREQVARDIEANPMNECSGAVAECARIARGTDPADPPDPRLSELTTRAAAIDLPSEEPDITDALRRIRRDIRLALTSRYDPHANPAADLERELGNMIVSSLRWMRVYGLDPLTCIETAERVQRERAEREILAGLAPEPTSAPDATAALRDDLTHALGSDHLARLALRAVEPALLAVEVDTAQRMQGDVDRERQRADKAGSRAALLREQVRDLKAERDAFRFRAEADQIRADTDHREEAPDA